MQKFIEFLTDKYIDEEHPLDDDISDGFPNWFSMQDMETISFYAEQWRIELLIKRVEKERADIVEKINQLES